MFRLHTLLPQRAVITLIGLQLQQYTLAFLEYLAYCGHTADLFCQKEAHSRTAILQKLGVPTGCKIMRFISQHGHVKGVSGVAKVASG